MATPSPGTITFAATSLLATGGHSRIYTAVSDGTPVVIKRDNDPITEYGTTLREIALLRTLAHPNVIELLGAGLASGRFMTETLPSGRIRTTNTLAIYAYSSPGGRPATSFQDVAGDLAAESITAIATLPFTPHGDLVSFLAKHGRKSIDVKRLMFDLLSAAEYIHARRIVHSDVKPYNVLVFEEGRRFVLADFGIATRVAPGEKRWGTAYTPDFRPPECKTGGATTASDIWAIASTVWYVIRFEDGKKRGLESDDVISLLDRMTVSDPDKRPSATELLADPYFSAITKVERDEITRWPPSAVPDYDSPSTKNCMLAIPVLLDWMREVSGLFGEHRKAYQNIDKIVTEIDAVAEDILVRALLLLKPLRKEMQCCGLACLILAWTLVDVETYMTPVEDFVKLTDGAATIESMGQMIVAVVQILDFDLLPETKTKAPIGGEDKKSAQPIIVS